MGLVLCVLPFTLCCTQTAPAPSACAPVSTGVTRGVCCARLLLRLQEHRALPSCRCFAICNQSECVLPYHTRCICILRRSANSTVAHDTEEQERDGSRFVCIVKYVLRSAAAASTVSCKYLLNASPILPFYMSSGELWNHTQLERRPNLYIILGSVRCVRLQATPFPDPTSITATARLGF